MSDETPDSDRKPDAVRIPSVYKGKGHGEDLDLACKADFAAVLGSKRVDRSNEDGWHFVTPFPRNGQTVYFPKWHDRAGADRYEWVDRGDGVHYGYLVDGAAEAVGFGPPN